MLQRYKKERLEVITNLIKMLWVILLLGLLVLVLMYTIPEAEGSFTYPAGDCWNYTYPINDTANSTQGFCCDNSTVYLNYTNAVNIFLELNNSERVVSNKQNCYYDVKCGNQTVPLTMCSATKDLANGESWSFKSSTCDLYMKCNACENRSQMIINRTYSIPYSIIRQNESGVQVITIGNTTIQLPSVGVYSHASTIDFNCPVGVLNDSTLDWTLDQCKEYLPYFYTMDSITKQILASSDRCDIRLQECMADRNKMQTERQGKVLLDSNTQASYITEVESCNKKLEIQINETKKVFGEHTVCKRDLGQCDGGSSILIGIMIVETILIAFMGYKYLSLKGRGGI